MTYQAPVAANPPLDATAEAKRSALRRTKLMATTALGLCVLVFAGAKSLEGRYPWLGFVAAFAEAATIGGLADWYAVVALFRRPLGLPIPHTAIIPENQNRIADNLGRFIEVNFLAPGPVREKLAEVDFSALVADWLAGPERAAGLASFVSRLVPRMLAADWGRIVFISSESALHIPAEMIHYGVSKTALLGVSRGLAELTAGSGVTVNAVLPGPTRSEGVVDFFAEMAREQGLPQEQMERDFIAQHRPSSLLRRLATVEEVANMVVYSCSRQSSATNGAALRVDGGVVRTIA